MKEDYTLALEASTSSMYKPLRDYVKDNWFKDVKFIQKFSKCSEIHILYDFENGSQVDYRGTIPDKNWENFWAAKVRYCFSRLRHTATVRYKDAYDKGKMRKNGRSICCMDFPKGAATKLLTLLTLTIALYPSFESRQPCG